MTTGAIRRAKIQIVAINKRTPNFLQAGCPSCRSTNSVRAVMENFKTYSQNKILHLLFNGHFPGEPGVPVFIEAKDDGDGGDNWTIGAISHAKLHSNHHHQQTNIQFFYRPDALPVAQPTVSKQ